jgi:lipoprotein-releasing system permease protein
VSDWTQEYGVYFQAIALEKTMMFIILLLVIAIAAFNLVSSLMMVVTDKTSEIAILRTIGTRPTMIMNIFMMQGLIIGAVGTLLGLVGGVILSLNTTAIVSFIQKLFHINLVSSSIFFLNYLPSRLYWSDVVHVCLLAFLLSLIATFYPSWKASHIQPADALRYE